MSRKKSSSWKITHNDVIVKAKLNGEPLPEYLTRRGHLRRRYRDAIRDFLALGATSEKSAVWFGNHTCMLGCNLVDDVIVKSETNGYPFYKRLVFLNMKSPVVQREVKQLMEEQKAINEKRKVLAHLPGRRNVG